jgi:beta-lactamase superfamily II metal-dependent hydrolase
LRLINDIKFDLPTSNTTEVTLIGTGGYGESCIVHIGENNWIIVDSCINPITNESLPLKYLQELEVDISNNVKLIICTHWHDDHIKGIYQLYEKCESAKFCVADTIDLRNFLYLVTLDYTKYTGSKISNSSTIEFNKCIDLLRKRNAVLKQASKNKILINEPYEKHTSTVISLSPSDYAKQRFSEEVSILITQFGENKKIVTSDPNSNSVALFIKLGTHRVILGADLEVNKNEKEGWLDILNSHENVFDKKSTLFKISHHGSENGYHERIWIELLENNTVAKLTPYNRGYGLPTIEMLTTYNKNTTNLFITSPMISSKKPKKRDRQTEKIISFFNNSLREIKYDIGIIRSRASFTNEEDWKTELFGNALKCQL